MHFVDKPTSHQNNFNLIRLFLAISVMFYHIDALSGKPALHFLSNYFDADKAVEAFFVISGYLIMKSYLRSTSLKDYLWKRALRIYPAYLVIILICAIGLSLISTLSFDQYFTHTQWYKFVFSNLVFLNFIEPSLPGVFEQHINKAVNGSLWSLKIEVCFYLLVPVIAFFRSKVNPSILYSIIFISSVLFQLLFKQMFVTQGKEFYLFISRQIPGQLFYFVLGMWYLEIESKKQVTNMLKYAGIIAVLAYFLDWGLIINTFILATSIFYVAFIFPTLKTIFSKNDISYGIYIYHFPIIQLLITFGVFNINDGWMGLVITVVATLLLSFISWKYLEEPILGQHKKLTLGN